MPIVCYILFFEMAVEPAGGSNPPREMVITNARNAYGPDLPVVHSVRGSV